MARVFVSYQRSDTLLLAHCLGYALRAGDHEPFVDTGTVPAGVAFAPAIDEWLTRADLVLVLLGPSFDYGRLRQPSNAVAFEWRRARFHGCAMLPVLYRTPAMVAADRLPAELRWLPALNAQLVADATLSADVDAIVALVPALARPPRPAVRALWIDDNPKNNVRERRRLREWGIAFDNVVSTDEAADQLRNAAYDLVITDLGRSTVDERSSLAGLDLLQSVLSAAGPPVIVYAGRNALRWRDEVLARGGFGSTNDPAELYALVGAALGRTLPADSELER